MQILYFLEDRAQEGFIKALVERVATDEHVALHHEIRSARHGSPRAIDEYKQFLKDAAGFRTFEADVLVVAIDGNCKGYREMVKQLGGYLKPNHPLSQKVVYAVPDPHIERWYLMDQKAFKKGVGLDRAPDLPSYKCEKDHYKQIVNQSLKESQVGSLLGGAEYAERIIEHIENLDALAAQDPGFGSFVEALRRRLRQSKGTR